VFEGQTPGDTVRCPVDGCEFVGTVGQVGAHAAEVDDDGHDALERRLERENDGAAADDDRTAIDEFVRLFEAAHGESAGYEADGQGGWLFPFDGGNE
jgi:hypothetical protein